MKIIKEVKKEIYLADNLELFMYLYNHNYKIYIYHNDKKRCYIQRYFSGQDSLWTISCFNTQIIHFYSYREAKSYIIEYCLTLLMNESIIK